MNDPTLGSGVPEELVRDQADVAEVLSVTVLARKAGWAEEVL